MRALLLLFPPLLIHAITFNELCEKAYSVSGDLIQTQGQVNASSHLKASALASNPLSLEVASSGIHGDDSMNSGMQYSGMITYSLKKSSVNENTALFYDNQHQALTQEELYQRQKLQISLKHDWYISLIEQERVEILKEQVNASLKSHSIGEKKVQAGRMSQMELQRLVVEKDNAMQALYVGEMEVDHIQETLREATMSKEEIAVDDMPFRFITTTSPTDRQIENSILLKKLDSQIRALEIQAKNAHYNNNDAYSIGLGATHEPTQNSIDIALTIPLNFGEKNEQTAAAFMSEKSALIHQRDIAAKKLRMSLAVLLEHLHFKEKRYQDALAAQETKKNLLILAQKGYEAGVMGQFEYISTQNDYFDTKLRSTELKRDYVNELASLEEKLGEMVQ